MTTDPTCNFRNLQLGAYQNHIKQWVGSSGPFSGFSLHAFETALLRREHLPHWCLCYCWVFLHLVFVLNPACLLFWENHLNTSHHNPFLYLRKWVLPTIYRFFFFPITMQCWSYFGSVSTLSYCMSKAGKLRPSPSFQ